jgi:hypothetical protein
VRRVAQDESAVVQQPNRARNRDRTDDLILTKDVLYRLSYASIPNAESARGKSVKVRGAVAGLKGEQAGQMDSVTIAGEPEFRGMSPKLSKLYGE